MSTHIRTHSLPMMVLFHLSGLRQVLFFSVQNESFLHLLTSLWPRWLAPKPPKLCFNSFLFFIFKIRVCHLVVPFEYRYGSFCIVLPCPFDIFVSGLTARIQLLSRRGVFVVAG